MVVKQKIAFIMSVPLPILGLCLCILYNLFGENTEEKNRNMYFKKLYKFLETNFLYLQPNFFQKGIIIIDH